MQNTDPAGAQAAPALPVTDRGLPRLIVRCSTCHSESVVRDAWACWSVERQEWELGQVFDHTFCEACEGECTIEKVPSTASR
jgi:hypothetical protein